jgi:hypothetical protein
MSNFVDAVVSRPISAVISAALTLPPAYTRLEPQFISGDPRPGLEARIHDPLWLLARQWQFGEFEGEDNGSPLLVQVKSDTSYVTAWQPGDPASNFPPQPLPSGVPLDPFIEREATPPDALGLRQRAEAGAYLVELLADAGLDARAALLAACPSALPAPDPSVPPEQSLVSPVVALLASGCPDSESAAQQLEAGVLPAWISAAPAAPKAAAQNWLRWYRANVSPSAAPSADSWIPERLEYRFSLRLSNGAQQQVLRAPAFEGGIVDWYAFDADPQGHLTLAAEPAPAPPDSRDSTVFASPLRFAGMPSDRYWQFEDGQVNLGMLESQPFDLGRLCLAEFALIYGNDWLVVPMDVSAGTFTTLREVAYTNTFGERFVVPVADDANRSGRFRMFSIVSDKGTTVPGLFIPPTALGSLEGTAVEDVLFLRDEMANMAWAVERFVQGRSGDPRNRGDEERPVNAVVNLEPQAEFQYELETAVPLNWIPFVPVATGIGTFELRKGTMHETDSSLGVLLRSTPFNIRDEEIPRAGIRVRRVPALARAENGSYLRWITRRASVGRGEGSSGLAFDNALKP